MGKPAVPDRWEVYKPMGTTVPGTRFMACKVPLKLALQRRLAEDERFGVDELIGANPNIGLVIDLTNTDRYYSKQEVLSKNVKYEKMFCPGRILPPTSVFKQFAAIVDRYLEKNKGSDSIIAVHCTHGINRTGYFICRYMIEKLKMAPEEAIKNFEHARGYPIEREIYTHDLKNGCEGGSEDMFRAGGKMDWRKIKAEARAERLQRGEAGSKVREGIAVNGVVKKPVVHVHRKADPLRYNFRPRDQGFFGPGREFEDGGFRPAPGSWRDEQRSYQGSTFNPNTNISYNSYHQRIPNPQMYQQRGPPHFHSRDTPQPFRSRAPFSFSQQNQNRSIPNFFPRFQNPPPRDSSPSTTPAPTRTFGFQQTESPQMTSMSGGLCKVYSPQIRFPEPFTSNPRPGGPSSLDRERQLGDKRRRWTAQQRAERKQQQKWNEMK